MPATTIRLEHELVQKAAALKQPEESISAFVRRLIEEAHRARRLHESAHAYERFIQENPKEREAMKCWESAPLSRPAKPKRR
jgi:predicted CopG family antitoxin